MAKKQLYVFDGDPRQGRAQYVEKIGEFARGHPKEVTEEQAAILETIPGFRRWTKQDKLPEPMPAETIDEVPADKYECKKCKRKHQADSQIGIDHAEYAK